VGSTIKEASQEGEREFERAHTHTLFYLAQCYGMLENKAKAAEYCHNTLRRQLAAHEYDPLVLLIIIIIYLLFIYYYY
jgi:hypothetical protein